MAAIPLPCNKKRRLGEPRGQKRDRRPKAAVGGVFPAEIQSAGSTLTRTRRRSPGS